MFKKLLSPMIAAAAVVWTTVAFAAPFGAATVPADVAKLVPEGAVLLGYTSSIEGMQQSLLKSVSAIEPQMAMVVAMGGPATQINMMVKKEGGPPGSGGVDTKSPVAFFIGKPDPATGMPVMGTIFKVADAATLQATQPTMKLMKLPGSNWVSLSSTTYALPSSATALGAGMLDATMSVNIDQKLAREVFKDQINMALSSMQMDLPEGALPRSQMEMLKQSQAANVARARAFIDSINEWNVGIDLNGPELDMLLRVTPADESQIAQPAAKMDRLSRLIPSGMAINCVFDTSVLKMLMESSVTMDTAGLPAEAKAKFDALMPVWMQGVGMIKTGMACGISFNEKGISIVTVQDADDPAAVIALTKVAIDALNKADLGIQVEPMTVAGKGVGYRMKFNMSQMMDGMGMGDMIPPAQAGQPDPTAMMQNMIDGMFGPDGMSLQYLIEGKYVIAVMGNASATDARKSVASGGADNALSESMADSLAKTNWGMVMDVRTVANEGLGMLRTMLGPMGAMLPPSLPSGKPVPMSFIGSTNGTTWGQMRIRTNMKSWYDLIQAMQKMESKAKAGGGAGGSRN